MTDIWKTILGALTCLALSLAGCGEDSYGVTTGDGSAMLAVQIAGAAPMQVASDSTGRLHAVVSGHYDGRVFYLTCGADCEQDASWRNIQLLDPPIAFGLLDTVSNRLEVTADGKVRVVVEYVDSNSGSRTVRYSQCDGDCLEPASWLAVDIGSDALGFASDAQQFDRLFAITPDGRPRLVGQRTIESDGQYITQGVYWYCESDCGAPESWKGNEIYSVPRPQRPFGDAPPIHTIDILADGRPVVLMVDDDLEGFSQQLLAFECVANCETEDATWTMGVIQTPWTVAMHWDADVEGQVLRFAAFSVFNDNTFASLGLFEADGEYTNPASWRSQELGAIFDLGTGFGIGVSLDTSPEGELGLVFFADQDPTTTQSEGWGQVMSARCRDNCMSDDAIWTLRTLALAPDLPLPDPPTEGLCGPISRFGYHERPSAVTFTQDGALWASFSAVMNWGCGAPGAVGYNPDTGQWERDYTGELYSQVAGHILRE